MEIKSETENFKKEDDEQNNRLCLCCKKNPIEYSCVPCNCHTLCKRCAMKMATGGKCKICKELFVGLRRIYE